MGTVVVAARWQRSAGAGAGHQLKYRSDHFEANSIHLSEPPNKSYKQACFLRNSKRYLDLNEFDSSKDPLRPSEVTASTQDQSNPED